MWFIAKEIPVWVIDWVNKTFLLNDTPSIISWLWMDWVIYLAFSYTWNILTLTDAPTENIFIDYYTTSSSISITSTKTLWNILTKVWDLLWQTSNSTNFSKSKVTEEINEVIRQCLRWRVTNLLNPNKIFRAWKLWFLEWRTNVRYKAGWIATAILEVWDTELLTETTNLLESGYAEIWWDIINYTSKTSTELVWVTGQTVQHLVWENIKQLYVMPVELEKPKNVFKIVNNSNNVTKTEIPLNSWIETINYDIIKRWTITLLQLTWFSDSDLIEVDYNKVFNDLVDDTDICPIPDDFWTSVIARLVAWSMWYDKSMPQAQAILNRWYWNLHNMFQYFTNKTIIIKQKLKPRPYSYNSLR